MLRTYGYKLKPTKTQVLWLEDILERLRHLQNSVINGRKAVYETETRTLSYNEQARELTVARQRDTYYKEVPAQFQQNVLKRVDLAFKAFFRRVRSGETPGYPRMRSRYRSFTWPLMRSPNGSAPQPIRATKTRYARLKVPKLGEVKVRLSRPLDGVPKACTVIKKASGWHVRIACELPDTPKVAPESGIGVDVGTKHFLTTSNGETVENPRFYRESEGLLKKHAKTLSRRPKGSRRWYQAVQVLARHHERTADKRDDFLAKIVNWLYYHLDNQVLVAEDLAIRNMARNTHLSQSIHDASWGRFFEWAASIAERDGLHFHQVNPRNTSQTCSDCGEKAAVKLTLRDSVFHCKHCGMSMDRDKNAALNILYRAASVLRGERWVANLKEARSCQPSGERLQLSFLDALRHSPVFRLG